MNKVFEKQQKLLSLLALNHPDYMQPSAQTAINCGNVVSYIKDMQYFLNVEVQELILGIGKNNSAIFKPWRAEHNLVSAKPFVPTKAIQAEAVDVLCFAVNICLAVGIEPTEIEELYNSIWQNNINRQQDGY